MTYGTALVDTIQSSTTGTPTQFQDGSGTQIGTLCRAWIQFVGSTQVKTGSFNVSSVTKNSTGNYTLTFTNALPDTAGSIIGMNEGDSGQANRGTCGYFTSTTTALIGTFACSTGASTDMSKISVAVFR